MKPKPRKQRSREDKTAFDRDNNRTEKPESFQESVKTLSREFDEQLKCIEGARGAAKLRAAIKAPVRLHGRVKAGK